MAYLTDQYDCPDADCGTDKGDDSASAPCRSEADEHLSTLPIEASDIKSVKMVKASSGGNGHEAWVRLKSCQGSLIIELSKGCTPRQTFTRGACEIEGISSY